MPERSAGVLSIELDEDDAALYGMEGDAADVGLPRGDVPVVSMPGLPLAAGGSAAITSVDGVASFAERSVMSLCPPGGEYSLTVVDTLAGLGPMGDACVGESPGENNRAIHPLEVRCQMLSPCVLNQLVTFYSTSLSLALGRGRAEPSVSFTEEYVRMFLPSFPYVVVWIFGV